MQEPPTLNRAKEDIPVVYHSFSAQFIAKVVKCLFPAIFHVWIRLKKKKLKSYLYNLMRTLHTS